VCTHHVKALVQSLQVAVHVPAEQHLHTTLPHAWSVQQCDKLTACVGDTHCRTQHAPNERVRSARSTFSDQPISSPPPRHARLRLTPGGCRRIQTCGRGAVACGCGWCVCLLLAVPELDHHRALTTRHAPACVAFHSASCSTCRALARCAEGAVAHRVGHQASLAAASGSSGSRHWCATRPPHARVTQPDSYC
jgi:hypothetical protein